MPEPRVAMVGNAGPTPAVAFAPGQEPFTFTRAELIDKATQWMQAEFPDHHNGEYYARLGLMIHFITDITPE